MDDGAGRASLTSADRTPGPAPLPPPGSSWGPAWLTTVADVLSFAIIGTVALVVVMTFRDFGITWDETWHMVYGDYVLDWYLSLGQDRSCLCYRVDYMYGGGFDGLGAVARRLSPLAPYETMRLFGGAIGVLGLWGTWRLARQLGGAFAGLAAVALLATTPVWHGHMFNNPKDMPFAVGYVWSLSFLVDVVSALPRPPRAAWVKLAIAIGLAMSVRIAGLLLLCYLGAAIFAYAVVRGRAARDFETGARTFWALLRPFGKTLLGAWAVMLVFWPWAQLDPIRRPFIALGRMSRFTLHERTMPFAGGQMETTEPRWDYMLHYYGLKIPLVILLLAIAGFVLFVLSARRRRRDTWQLSRMFAIGIVAFAIVFPQVYAIVARSVVYDGLRHFLFLTPPLVVIAALAFVELARRLRAKARWAAPVLAVAVAGSAVRMVPTMVRLHPHEYVYFNEVIGGLPGAYGNYDTDYYGNTYKEAFEALYDKLWEDDPDRYMDAIWMLDGCIPDFIALEYMEAGFVFREKYQRHRSPDFYLAYTRGDCHERRDRSPVYLTVEREGTLLNQVRDLRADPDEIPPPSPIRDKSSSKGKSAKIKTSKPKRKSGRTPAARKAATTAKRPRPRPSADEAGDGDDGDDGDGDDGGDDEPDDDADPSP